MLKFPSAEPFGWIIKTVVKRLLRGDLNSISRIVKTDWVAFCKGLHQNQTEYKCWRRCRAPFLAPTYFSLFGLVNIQKREFGEELTIKDWLRVVGEMGRNTGGDIGELDPHYYTGENFVKKSPSEYCLIDYGDNDCTNSSSFSGYVLKWHKELTEILCTKEPPPVV
ncbi:MAG: hypothetical protein AAB837_00675 [Patescibacteria group bacterium]